uniref:Uncharacterized protein n=1 Tax=Eutreptiella gymnastica TaxID=73025 RepID=A0A7S1IW84_9EUGL
MVSSMEHTSSSFLESLLSALALPGGGEGRGGEVFNVGGANFPSSRKVGKALEEMTSWVLLMANLTARAHSWTIEIHIVRKHAHDIKSSVLILCLCAVQRATKDDQARTPWGGVSDCRGLLLITVAELASAL